MAETTSVGLQFREALLEYSIKHQTDDGICGIKIDLRSQNIDLIVGIKFVDGESNFAVCTAGRNCESADEDAFELLSDALKTIGVESKSGSAIMIKRNAQIVTTTEGCETIEEGAQMPETPVPEETPKKRGGLFGLFSKK